MSERVRVSETVRRGIEFGKTKRVCTIHPAEGKAQRTSRTTQTSPGEEEEEGKAAV